MAPLVHVTTEAGAPIACAALVSRHRGRLVVTTVAKATFALVPDGAAALRAPAPIVPHDCYRQGNPVASLEAASDLVPYKPRVDVTFVGRAHLPGAGGGVARLAVFRRGPLFDKAVHVARAPAGPAAPVPLVYELAVRDWGPEGQNPVGAEHPVLFDPKDPRRPVGFGPLRAEWPARARKR
ncbi:MAG TPA: DUF2169 domain-containing protein, partial [Minicystis sp.]|nr:DUF2169 domain-containing protein [Minicystis sp.]